MGSKRKPQEGSAVWSPRSTQGQESWGCQGGPEPHDVAKEQDSVTEPTVGGRSFNWVV